MADPKLEALWRHVYLGNSRIARQSDLVDRFRHTPGSSRLLPQSERLLGRLIMAQAQIEESLRLMLNSCRRGP
jgi:hypothetical protein